MDLLMYASRDGGLSQNDSPLHPKDCMEAPVKQSHGSRPTPSNESMTCGHPGRHSGRRYPPASAPSRHYGRAQHPRLPTATRTARRSVSQSGNAANSLSEQAAVFRDGPTATGRYSPYQQSCSARDPGATGWH